MNPRGKWSGARDPRVRHGAHCDGWRRGSLVPPRGHQPRWPVRSVGRATTGGRRGRVGREDASNGGAIGGPRLAQPLDPPGYRAPAPEEGGGPWGMKERGAARGRQRARKRRHVGMPCVHQGGNRGLTSILCQRTAVSRALCPIVTRCVLRETRRSRRRCAARRLCGRDRRTLCRGPPST